MQERCLQKHMRQSLVGGGISVVSAISPGLSVPGSKRSCAWQIGGTSSALRKLLNK